MNRVSFGRLSSRHVPFGHLQTRQFVAELALKGGTVRAAAHRSESPALGGRASVVDTCIRSEASSPISRPDFATRSKF